jgi:hypothetical protein
MKRKEEEEAVEKIEHKSKWTRSSKRKQGENLWSTTQDSPSRKKVRVDVMEAKLKQAEKVNKHRQVNALKLNRKDPLDMGDICTISMSGLKKVHFPHFPVMITNVSLQGNLKVYTIASK